jgi:hypothetical protein
MGLDIFIRTDNHEQIFTPGYYDSYFKEHSLSRTFCNFMCRQNVSSGEPELDQISQITSVDISPLYQMETYTGEEGLEFLMETVENEEERQNIIAQARQCRDRLKGNIDIVLATINALIDRLSKIDNLPSLLNDYGYDTLDSKTYFANFDKDEGDGYIDNNFGRDLRNFKRFLEFAKEKGAATVYFNYG